MRGRRSVTRSWRAALVLVGGLACAWGGTFVLPAAAHAQDRTPFVDASNSGCVIELRGPIARTIPCVVRTTVNGAADGGLQTLSLQPVEQDASPRVAVVLTFVGRPSLGVQGPLDVSGGAFVVDGSQSWGAARILDHSKNGSFRLQFTTVRTLDAGGLEIHGTLTSRLISESAAEAGPPLALVASF